MIDNNGDGTALCHASPLCFSHHSVCPPKYWIRSWEEDAPLVMVKDIKVRMKVRSSTSMVLLLSSSFLSWQIRKY